MPANTFLGQRSVTISLVGEASYTLSRTQTYAELLAVPGGGTALVLPDNPSDGDYYVWVNPDNSVSAISPLILELSTASITDGILLQGGTSASFTAPGTSGAAVFFDAARGWQLFVSAASSSEAAAAGRIVWRPGVAPVPGVVETPAQVKAAIVASSVPLDVYVDSSIAPAIWPVGFGVVDCKGTTRFLSYNATQNDGTQVDQMTISDGTTLHRPREFTWYLQVNALPTTVNSLSFNTGPGGFGGIVDTFFISRGASFEVQPGATIGGIDIPDTGILRLALDGQAAGVGIGGVEGVAPAIQLTGTSEVDITAIFFNGAGANVVAGGETGTVRYAHDSTSGEIRSSGSLDSFSGTYVDTRTDLATWAKPASGTTGQRPSGLDVLVGQMFYDTTFQRPFWWNGTGWQGYNQLSTVISAPLSPVTPVVIAINVTPETAASDWNVFASMGLSIAGSTSVAGEVVQLSVLKDGAPVAGLSAEVELSAVHGLAYASVPCLLKGVVGQISMSAANLTTPAHTLTAISGSLVVEEF